MSKKKLPKWSRRKAKGKPNTWAETPMFPGPDTNMEAFRADLKVAVGKLMAANGGHAKPEDLDAVLRDVCSRHGVRVGEVLDVGKLSGPLRDIATHAAAAMKLRLVREVDGEQRWLLTDGRWAIIVTESDVPLLIRAGVPVPDEGVPATEPLEGQRFDLSELVDLAPRLLEEAGIRHSEDKHSFTNPKQMLILDVWFAVDVVAALVVMGAVRAVLNSERKLLEARAADGRVVGYGQGIYRETN